MEYVTKKVPKGILPEIRELQAEYTLAEGRKVTESEIIARAIQELKAKPVVNKKKYTFWDLYGSIKGGPRTNAARDIDDVVYGKVDKN